MVLPHRTQALLRLPEISWVETQLGELARDVDQLAALQPHAASFHMGPPQPASAMAPLMAESTA
jgi:hypothetical protein